jgi:hypothetical protein
VKGIAGSRTRKEASFFGVGGIRQAETDERLVESVEHTVGLADEHLGLKRERERVGGKRADGAGGAERAGAQEEGQLGAAAGIELEFDFVAADDARIHDGHGPTRVLGRELEDVGELLVGGAVVENSAQDGAACERVVGHLAESGQAERLGRQFTENGVGGGETGGIGELLGGDELVAVAGTPVGGGAEDEAFDGLPADLAGGGRFDAQHAVGRPRAGGAVSHHGAVEVPGHGDAAGQIGLGGEVEQRDGRFAGLAGRRRGGSGGVRELPHAVGVHEQRGAGEEEPAVGGFGGGGIMSASPGLRATFPKDCDGIMTAR